jgi:hypothetical protein
VHDEHVTREHVSTATAAAKPRRRRCTTGRRALHNQRPPETLTMRDDDSGQCRRGWKALPIGSGDATSKTVAENAKAADFFGILRCRRLFVRAPLTDA